MNKLITTLLLIINFNTFAQNSPQRFDPIQIILSPNSSNWNYRLGEKAEVSILILKYGVAYTDNVMLNYQISDDMMPYNSQGEICVKNGKSLIFVEGTKKAGFRQLKVKAKIDNEFFYQQVNLGFGVNEIKPTVENPEDFDSFWNNVINNARSKDLDVKLTKLKEYSTKNVTVYLISLYTGVDKRRIYGYLCKPNDKEKHPVLFNPPGAGVKSIKPYIGYAENGFISLAIEIHGINPLPNKKLYSKAETAIGDYWQTGINSKDDYYYKAVYVACVRSVDYLCSLPEFNGKAFVSGGSQGGALAIVTAALNDKITALASFYPALSDITGFLYGRGGGWPLLFRYSKATNKHINTLAYYDVVNFARRIKVPGFYSTGYNDNTCCPTSVFSAFNVISAPKELYITPSSGHWRFNISDKKSIAFFKQKCIDN